MRPHDPTDLRLAPVALQVDSKIQELAGKSPAELAYHVASEVDRNPRTEVQRGRDIVDAIVHLVDLCGWHATWDERCVRLSHEGRSLVLGVTREMAEFVQSGSG